MENLSIENINAQYANEWVLLANPSITGAQVLAGQPLYHHTDKKKVCEFAQAIAKEYNEIKIIFAGKIASVSKLGIFRVFETKTTE